MKISEVFNTIYEILDSPVTPECVHGGNYEELLKENRFCNRCCNLNVCKHFIKKRELMEKLKAQITKL